MSRAKKPKKIGPFTVGPYLVDGKPTGKWSVNIPQSVSHTGKRQRPQFATEAKALAEAKRLDRERTVKHRLRAERQQFSGLTLSEIVSAWCDLRENQVKAGSLKPGTLEKSGYHLDRLIERLGKDDLADIDEEKITAYQADRVESGIKPRSVNDEVATLRQVLEFAQSRGVLRELPRVKPLPIDPEPDVDLPTEEEIVRIIGELPSPTNILVWFIAATGCRKGEAFNLTWDNFDAEAETFTVTSVGRGHGPKNAQSHRNVPLDPSLAEAIDNLPRRSKWVFPSLKDPRKQTTDFEKALNSAIVRADVKRKGKPIKIKPHDLRKAFITRNALRGVPLDVTQRMVGHKPGSPVTRKIYTRVQDEALREWVAPMAVENVMGSSGQHENIVKFSKKRR